MSHGKQQKILHSPPQTDTPISSPVTELLSKTAQPSSRFSTSGLLTGRIVALSENVPLVECATLGTKSAFPAVSLVPLTDAHIGNSILLMCADGDPLRPVIMGVLPESGQMPATNPEVEIDGKTIKVAATEKLILRCGKASITLTHEGKILLNGKYIASHSTGIHRVRGGSVRLN